MASITNTTITSYDYLLRQYYSSNRDARKTINRGAMKAEDLVRADSEALKKVARNLRTMDYGKDNVRFCDQDGKRRAEFHPDEPEI